MRSNTCRFYDIGPFRFDAAKNFLLREGKRTHLSPKASNMLGILVRKQGELVARNEILSAVWKKVYVEEGAVDHYISELRKTFRVIPGGEEWIETVPRRGYRFVGPVRAVGERPASRQQQKVKALTYAGAAFFGCFLSILVLGPGSFRPRPKVSDIVALTHDGFAKRSVGLVMIGDQIYFSEIAGTSRTAHVPVRGGETVLNPSFAGFELQDVSPDGRQILATKDVGSNFELWILPAQGGTGRYLGLRGQEPTWSPNAGWIAYHDEKYLWVARSDGSNARRLTTVAGVISSPHWSPDGRVIRFSLGDGTTGTSIHEIRVDGAGRHELGPGLRSKLSSYGRWTADGRWFVFERSSSDHSELWARKEKCGLLYWQCGQLFGLTQGPVGYARPLLSPDGKEIFSLGLNERSEVQRFDIHSRSFIPFAALDGTPATQVDFSRDETWMAYRNLSDHSIWRSKIDGSEKLRLTAPPLDAYQPHWSPDGKRIAFITADFKICIIPAAGGAVKQLGPGAVKQGVPTWSPDGKRVAYGEPLFKHDPADMQIHILDVSDGRISVLPGSSGLWTARWSPNGRFIAALKVGTSDERHSDSSELEQFDFVTGKWITLAKIHYINEPSWSRDSQFVYFDTASARESDLYRVRISNHHLEKLTSLHEITRDLDNWSGVAPDGSALIVKDTVISEIYAMRVDWP